MNKRKLIYTERNFSSPAKPFPCLLIFLKENSDIRKEKSMSPRASYTRHVVVSQTGKGRNLKQARGVI
jgi:hypothetical protein